MQTDPLAGQAYLNAVRNAVSARPARSAEGSHAEPSEHADPADGRVESRSAEETGVYGPRLGLLSGLRGPTGTGRTEETPASRTSETSAETSPEPVGIPVSDLEPVVRQAMEERGLVTTFSPGAMAEVQKLGGPSPIQGPGVKDLRSLAWASIDNADTRDIDQLAFAFDLGEGRTRLLVAIADVAEAVPRGSQLDRQAQANTTTVYAPGHTCSMLPEELSQDWTSLWNDQDRRALVTELIVDKDGKVESSSVFEAAVRNKAKLDYEGVSAWMAGGAEPEALARVPGMDEQIRLQMEVGQRLGKAAEASGALEFETDRVLTRQEGGRIVDLVAERKNLASEAVAHQMIASNTAMAQFLHQKGFPVFQRVVKPPERWDRMQEVAVAAASKLPAGHELPSEVAVLPERPDPAALSRFLREYKARDPEGATEVTLSMLKLMGGGDYLVTAPGQPLQGHFGQGVAGGEIGYAHSTAPNRRYPDIITQRLAKAALRGEPCPYTMEELEQLAARCNEQESKAKSAERMVRKAAVARYLSTQIGEEYEAVITGQNKRKGTFVRVIDPPIEGMLVTGSEGLDVGDHLQVRLRGVDLEKGHIDFGRVVAEQSPSAGTSPHGPLLA